MRTLLLLLACAAVSACGGSGGGSDPGGDDPPAPDAPQNVRAESGLRQATLEWDTVEGAESYNLYYAHEAGLDPDNYGSYEGGTLVLDVTSPYTVDSLDTGPVYHFVVTARDDNGESGPSEEVIAVTRYDKRGDTVADLENGLEWRRCVYGQTWNAQTRSCDGEATRLTNDEAEAMGVPGDPGADGWRRPLRSEITTIVFCSNGDPSYFVEEQQPCSRDTTDYDMPTIWPKVFPNTPNDANYWPVSACVFPDQRSFSFAAGGPNQFCHNPTPDVALYLRQVRPIP